MDARFIQTEAADLTSQDVAVYTPDAWSDGIFLDILQEKARQLEDERAYGEARELARVLEQALKSSGLSDSVKQRLTTAQATLLMAAFPTLDPDEQASMIRNHLLLAFEMQTNLKSKLLFWNKIQADAELFKNLRLKLIGAVAENSAEIAGRKVKEWVADYNKATNNKTSRGRIDQVQFISQHPSTRQLNAEDRQILLFVMDLYDWLRDPKQDVGDVPNRAESGKAEAGSKSVQPAGGLAVALQRPGPKPIYKPGEPSSDIIRPTTPPQTPLRAKETEQRTRPKPAERAFVTQQKQMTNIPLEPSEEAKRQMKKLSEQALYDEPLSISQALINAGLGAEEVGSGDSGTRAGKNSGPRQEEKQQSKPKAPASGPVPQAAKQPMPANVPAPRIPEEGSRIAKPKIPTPPQKLGSLPPAHNEERLPAPKIDANPQAAPSSSPKEEGVTPEKVINLKKNLTVDLDGIASPQELAKITPDDLRQVGFENGLEKTKQKIIELSGGGASMREAVNSFQRSPLYNIYISMVVAVMNDSSGDQKAAFERVAKNYEQANRPYLQRSEFLAVHKLKKELADMGGAK